MADTEILHPRKLSALKQEIRGKLNGMPVSNLVDQTHSVSPVDRAVENLDFINEVVALGLGEYMRQVGIEHITVQALSTLFQRTIGSPDYLVGRNGLELLRGSHRGLSNTGSDSYDVYSPAQPSDIYKLWNEGNNDPVNRLAKLDRQQLLNRISEKLLKD